MRYPYQNLPIDHPKLRNMDMHYRRMNKCAAIVCNKFKADGCDCFCTKCFNKAGL